MELCILTWYLKRPSNRLEIKEMRTQTMLFLVAILALSVSARAGGREGEIHRIQESALIFQEILDAPDSTIPLDLLQSAQCIAVIPSELKLAFFFGANYGKGLVTCRAAKSWSAPVFITIGGGSFGFQFGGSSTDFILVFRGRRGLRMLLNDKFKIGGDASGAVGPIGRSAAASTDIAMHAEILTYSRSRGIFAGVSLSGAVVQTDNTAIQTFYGSRFSKQDILDGKVPVPPEAMALEVAVSKATGTPVPTPPPPASAAKTQ
jgi:SH3 domain-containing YSC84-like protein 1